MIEREKVVAALAGVVLLGGIYDVAVAFLTPAPEIEVRDTSLPEPPRKNPAPVEYSRFAAAEIPTRNPFSYAEGWTPLVSDPLPPPPMPAAAWPVPLLGVVAREGRDEPGFVYLDSLPREVAPDAGDGDGSLEASGQEAGSAGGGAEGGDR